MHASLNIFVGIPVSRSSFFEPSGEVNNKCAEGHMADLKAKFCPECGGVVRLVDAEKATYLFARASTEYGWGTPEEGFSALVNPESEGWVWVRLADPNSTAGRAGPFAVKLVNLSIESGPDDKEFAYGLGIPVAKVDGLGESTYSAKVLELPLSGFQEQSEAVQDLARLLGIEESARLYPQVRLSY
jgi:hypothetical protein